MSAADGPPVLFLDLDGTVRHGYGELGRFVNRPRDVVVFAAARERIETWQRAGGVCIGITNQEGVARGHLTEAVHREIMAETCRQAGLDHALACTHHRDDACWCRKPRAGLLWQAVAWVNQTRLVLPPRAQCLMVGDRPEDAAAARAAGVHFVQAANWRDAVPVTPAYFTGPPIEDPPR